MVFRRIQDYGFKLKEEKREFFMNKTKYQGQVIDENDREPDPARASTLENVSSLQSLLGLCQTCIVCKLR